MYFGFCLKPKQYAQNDLIVPQIQELHAWLGWEFYFLLTHQDAFFCSHCIRFLIIFARYKISVCATEGLVQHLLAKRRVLVVYWCLLFHINFCCLLKVLCFDFPPFGKQNPVSEYFKPKFAKKETINKTY